MADIIVILGKTRSGKDSIAEVVLKEIPNSIKLKFADPFKRYTEQAYGLPAGALELQEYRDAIVPGTSHTFLDLMIFSYQAYDAFDPLFWKQHTFQLIKQELLKGTTLVLTDVRHPLEAKYLAALANEHRLILVSVYKSGCPSIASDASLGANFEMLSYVTDDIYSYINDGTLCHLQNWSRWMCRDVLRNTK